MSDIVTFEDALDMMRKVGELVNRDVKANRIVQKIIDKNDHHDELIDQIKLSGLQIGYIDVSSPGKEMDEKNGGVGLARKIGMDEALKIFKYYEMKYTAFRIIALG